MYQWIREGGLDCISRRGRSTSLAILDMATYLYNNDHSAEGPDIPGHNPRLAQAWVYWRTHDSK